MEKKESGFTVRPYPRIRRLVMDAGWMARRRHMIHGLLEVDVTKTRQILQRYKESNGERISFTAFMLACLGQAVDADRRVHACRNWRNQLVLFDDVDVLLSIEIEVGDEKFPLVQPVRAVNRRTVRELHDEIRAIQADPSTSVGARGPLMRWFYLLPTFLRHALYWAALKNPHWWKASAGTVGLTSVGMFGAGSGWGLGMPNHTLAVTLGGMVKKPGVVEGQIAVREYLNVTVSFDHDVVDGAPAARFCQRLTELVENAYGLDEFR